MKKDILVGARVNFRLELRGESGGLVLGYLAVDDISYVNCDHGMAGEKLSVFWYCLNKVFLRHIVSEDETKRICILFLMTILI